MVEEQGASLRDRAVAASPSSPTVSPLRASIPSAGMTPYGPSHPDYPKAPRDWDGGPYLCRDGGLYHMRGYGWEHGLGRWNPTADWDRVAYTAQAIEARRAETQSGSVHESAVPAGDAPTSPTEQLTPASEIAGAVEGKVK